MSAVLEPEVVSLGFTPRAWQVECAKRLRRFSVVVVHRRGGKTVLAILRLVDAALRCQKERGRYGYVAPLLKQAKGIAWDYLKAYARKVPGTQINEGELWVEFANGARIRLFGADNPDTLRGYYFDGIVIDEVAQTKKELWEDVIRPALSDRLGWSLFIGTPQGINLFSELYFKAQADADWYAGLYTCRDTDALTAAELADAERTMRPSIFAQEYLCDFTASSDNNLITIHDVLAAEKRGLLHQRLYDYAPKILGIDIAHQGGDRCVMFPRQGLQAFPPKVHQGLPEKNYANEVEISIEKWKPHVVYVDCTGGYGHEVISRLRDKQRVAQSVVFSWKANSERFINYRAELWFKMADWLKSGGALSCGEHMTQLQAELCAPTYDNDNAAGRLQLESKDDIRKRLGASPDLADALAITFATTMETMDSASTSSHAATEYDPLARVG